MKNEEARKGNDEEVTKGMKPDDPSRRYEAAERMMSE